MRNAIPVLLAGLLSVSAFAGEPGMDQASFDALDKNADQKLSAAEVAGDAKLAQSFAKADQNQDGYLSRAEYDAYKKV